MWGVNFSFGCGKAGLRCDFGGTQIWSIYADAALDGVSGNCGLGWLLQRPGAAESLPFQSNRRFASSVLVAEALAVKAALLKASTLRAQRINVFSDSKVLMSLINRREMDISVRNVLLDIFSLSHSFVSVSFHFIPRVGNAAADSLAKAALFYLKNIPPSEV
ncbi:hypothetical protein Bca4012_059568 [Brassica carinata]